MIEKYLQLSTGKKKRKIIEKRRTNETKKN